MKRIFDWQVILGLSLVALSAAVYLIHFFIFRDPHHIFIYLLGDIAFVFLEVLLVTLILHKLLSYREMKTMHRKNNMVIGVFFSDVGTELLKDLSVLDMNTSNMTEDLLVAHNWSEKEFMKARKFFNSYHCAIEYKQEDLAKLKDFLSGKREFLLNILKDPNLLEHESFTDLLLAVFHLTEELAHRENIKGLPESDYKHIAGDITRVYQQLGSVWLTYMNHLKSAYPYLFSLAVRTNPFDINASVEVS